MESFKKVISLNQASKISGYTQDYLGYLIRKGEIKGTKKGRVWFTTKEDVENYIFKKKVLSQKLALGLFFSPTRTRKIIIATIVVFLVIFTVWANHVNKELNKNIQEKSTLSSDAEGEVFDVSQN